MGYRLSGGCIVSRLCLIGKHIDNIEYSILYCLCKQNMPCDFKQTKTLPHKFCLVTIWNISLQLQQVLY